MVTGEQREKAALVDALAIEFHTQIEGEYGCPGAECPGVKRLVEAFTKLEGLGRASYLVGAEFDIPGPRGTSRRVRVAGVYGDKVAVRTVATDRLSYQPLRRVKALLTDGGNQQKRVDAVDPAAPRTVNGPTRDVCSSCSDLSSLLASERLARHEAEHELEALLKALNDARSGGAYNRGSYPQGRKYDGF